MKKNNNNIKDKKLKDQNYQLDDVILENKEVEKSLETQINFDIIDNFNAYYSERYGWTLKKN